MRQALLWRPADNDEASCKESREDAAAERESSRGESDLVGAADGAENAVQCLLCRQFCRLALGAWGLCGVRVNQDGVLYTIVDDQVAALNLDPVEKKPLYHFLPGSMTYSLGTQGCNMHCRFCQNHDLAHSIKQDRVLRGQHVNPAEIGRAHV